MLRSAPVKRLEVLGSALAAAALAASCAPEPGPVKVAVLAWDAEADAYGLEVVEIVTLDDVPAMQGDAATPVGAAEIVVDLSQFVGIPSEAEFRDAVIVDAGASVEAQFLEQDGVLWPQDFHSLNLATAYYNFERARLYALGRGMDPEGPTKGITFFYFPEFSIPDPGDEPEPLADNAAFFPLLRSFLLLPFDQLQEIPLPMNEGVIAHEYAHAIFNAEVHGGSWLPDYVLSWPASSPGAAILGTLEEGYADAWAVGVSGDPRFARHSLGAFVGDTRDVDVFSPNRHCYSQAQFEDELQAAAIGGEERAQAYWLQRQYQLGSVFAAALYRAGARDGTSYDRVMDALFRSYASVGTLSLRDRVAADPDGSALDDLAIPVLALLAGAGVDDAARVALCEVMMDRLAIPPARLGGACDGVTALDDCR